jgi:hypothetical protein
MKARLRSDRKKTEGTRCSNCRRIAPDYDIINLGSIESGYRILCGQIIGDPEEDLLALFGRLVEKIRRALSIKHLKQGSLGLQVADQVVRGRIEWDQDEDGRAPLLVIDGREITWDHCGHMLMTFEGWQFKLEILDKSEEP